jgi:hypothetical protein
VGLNKACLHWPVVQVRAAAHAGTKSFSAANLGVFDEGRSRNVNKTLNLVLMILMAGLAVVEGYGIVQNGANARNVLFCLLFAAFAVRRFLIHQKLSA